MRNCRARRCDYKISPEILFHSPFVASRMPPREKNPRARQGSESRDVGRARCAPRRPDVAISTRCFAALGGSINTYAARR